ncbi:MAG: transposase [Terracidiphilus sp.]
MFAFCREGRLQVRKRTLGWSSEQFRAMAVERMRTSNHIGRLCDELGVSRRTLEKWRKQMGVREPEPALVERAETLLEQNQHLKRALAEKVLEVDFLQGALQHVEARRQQNTASGARTSTPKSGA